MEPARAARQAVWLIAAMLPAVAAAQANFGSVALGSGVAQAVTVTIPSAATVGSIAAVIQGAPNLDFTNAGGGTCAVGTAYAAAATCTVEVIFFPTAPGLRRGAVVLNDNAGNVLATTPIYGVGTAPQAAFQPTVLTSVGTGLFEPDGVAVDAVGNIFVANGSSSSGGGPGVYEILAAGGYATVKPLATGTIGGKAIAAQAVAVDGSGDVFFIINSNGVAGVYEILAVNGSVPADPTIVPIGSGFSDPTCLAVDGAGNVFVADFGLGDYIVEIPAAGGYSSVVHLGNSAVIQYPICVAVDESENLFVTTYIGVAEIPAAGGYTEVNQISAEPAISEGIAVDNAENIYVEHYNGLTVLLAAGGYTNSQILASRTSNGGFTLDGGGNLFYTAQYGVQILDVVDPPSLAFNSTTDVGTTDTRDGPLTTTVRNIGNQPLIFATPPTGANPSYPADFPVNAKDTNLCAAGSSLAVGASCDVSMIFAPSQIGTLTESVVLTDNAFSQANATQSFSVTGVGGVPQTISFPPITGATATTFATSLTATASSGLPVSFVSLTPEICTAYGSGTSGVAYFYAYGFCTIQASQAGNSQYPPAIPVSQTFGVGHAKQSITFDQIPTEPAGMSFPIYASASSGLPVTLTSITPSVCTISDSSVTLIAYGQCAIEAWQDGVNSAGNIEYFPAFASQQFGVAHAHQNITFPSIQNQPARVTLTLTAAASSGLPVTYTSNTPTVCTISGATASLISAGKCSITATQPGLNAAGNSEYFPAAPVTESFTVARAEQLITIVLAGSQIAGQTVMVRATAPSGLPVSLASGTPAVCTISGSSLSLLKAGICTITASVAGNSGYYSATLTEPFLVLRADQTIAFPAVPAQVVGTPLTLAATASSGLAVSFASTAPAVCTVSGVVASFAAAGTCAIQASQAGNNIYFAAPTVTQSFAVTAP
jgi:hypothetical protein